jgi:uncharacterized protein YgiM (DUF1202 family)
MLLRALLIILGFAIPLGGLLGCSPRPAAEKIDLPPTPVLSIRSNWAVVDSSFLRLRQEPLAGSGVLAHIRRGAVLEVLSRTDQKEVMEDASGYWYQVSYAGLRGWVFGAFLEIVDSKAKAEALAAQLQ